MGQVTQFRGRSTHIERSKDVDRYIYHRTAVVTHNKRRHTVTLDHGGWMTATSKVRMNQAAFEYELGFLVYQKNYEWFVTTKAGTFDFRCGMRISLKTGKLLRERNDWRNVTDHVAHILRHGT